jgi:hypothetical protein
MYPRITALCDGSARACVPTISPDAVMVSMNVVLTLGDLVSFRLRQRLPGRGIHLDDQQVLHVSSSGLRVPRGEHRSRAGRSRSAAPRHSCRVTAVTASGCRVPPGDPIGRRRLLFIGGSAFALISVGAAHSVNPEMIAGATLIPPPPRVWTAGRAPSPEPAGMNIRARLCLITANQPVAANPPRPDSHLAEQKGLGERAPRMETKSRVPGKYAPGTNLDYRR